MIKFLSITMGAFVVILGLICDKVSWGPDWGIHIANDSVRILFYCTILFFAVIGFVNMFAGFFVNKNTTEVKS